MINRVRLLLVIALILSALPMVAHAAEEEALVVGTAGISDPDGSILYSILMASSTEELSDLTITSPLPEGATFVEAFWTPSDATFNGEEDGVVSWSLPELPADSVIGPFTYRVTFENAAEEAPVNVPASVTVGDQTFEAALTEGILEPLAPSGSITVDSEGTDGLVTVEDTGVLIEIPADTFDQEVTLIFERQPFDDSLTLPEIEELWWCTLYSITTEPAVAIESPITILLPTRKTTTPGLAMQFFYQTPDGEWEALVNTRAEADVIANGGNHAALVDLTFEQPLEDQVIAAGTDAAGRAKASLNFRRVKSPYIEQDNIIAVLIG